MTDGKLVAEVRDDGNGGADPGRQGPDGPQAARRGARRVAARLEPAGGPDDRSSGASMRVVIAEDLALLRDGLDAAPA